MMAPVEPEKARGALRVERDAAYAARDLTATTAV
jgi:hypothetical protein